MRLFYTRSNSNTLDDYSELCHHAEYNNDCYVCNAIRNRDNEKIFRFSKEIIERINKERISPKFGYLYFKEGPGANMISELIILYWPSPYRLSMQCPEIPNIQVSRKCEKPAYYYRKRKTCGDYEYRCEKAKRTEKFRSDLCKKCPEALKCILDVPHCIIKINQIKQILDQLYPPIIILQGKYPLLL